MTRATDSSSTTIRISCGHRVPRVPVLSEPNERGQRTKRYWCEDCGKFGMSGNACSGERAFDFLFQLRDEVAGRGIVIIAGSDVDEQGVAVMRALGADVRRSGT